MFVKYPRLATPTRNGLWGKKTSTFQTVGGNKILDGSLEITGSLEVGIDGEPFAINQLDNMLGNDYNFYLPFYGKNGQWRIYPQTLSNLNLSPCLDLDFGRIGFGTSVPQVPFHFNQASNSSNSAVFERFGGGSRIICNNNNSNANITVNTDLGGIAFSGRFNGANNPVLWVSGLFGQYTGNGTTRTGNLYFSVQNSGVVNTPCYMHQDGRVILGRAAVATPPQTSVTVRGHSGFTNAFSVQNSSDLEAFGIVNSIRQAFFGANVRFNVRSVVGSTSLLDTDFGIQINASGGASTAELADISSLAAGAVQVVIKNDVSANNVTVNPRSGQTILTGSATLTTSARVAGFMAINSTTWIRIF